MARAPRLIELLSHRFLPETPSKAGNPVFSMYGWDTIDYGADLTDDFNNEFNTPEAWRGGPYRHIPFWSGLAEDSEKWVRLSVSVKPPGGRRRKDRQD